MRERVLQTIREHDLVHPGDHVLVAVSGGADSVALACLLSECAEDLAISISLAHLNHALRGQDADMDAAFVNALADDLGSPFYEETVDVQEMAGKRGWSLEMAGREARYDFFSRLALKVGASRLATGHTWNDQAETVLMRLCQGAGVTGLRGIPYHTQRDGVAVIRPLRDVRREELESYLLASGRAHREDASNQDPRFLRNRFRYEVMPLLQDVLPSVQEALVRSSRLADSEYAWLAEQTEKLLSGPMAQDSHTLRADLLTELPVALQRHVVRTWLLDQCAMPQVLTLEHVEQVVTLASSGTGSHEVHLPGAIRVIRRYEELAVLPVQQTSAVVVERRVEVPGETVLEELGLTVVATESKGRSCQVGDAVGRYPAMACIRRDDWRGEGLVVRSWRPGDRLYPTGMEGSRKLQDIFVDLKVPQDQRAGIPVFACQEEIVWLPGYRVDRRWALSGEHDPCYEIRVVPGPIAL